MEHILIIQAEAAKRRRNILESRYLGLGKHYDYHSSTLRVPDFTIQLVNQLCFVILIIHIALPITFQWTATILFALLAIASVFEIPRLRDPSLVLTAVLHVFGYIILAISSNLTPRPIADALGLIGTANILIFHVSLQLHYNSFAGLYAPLIAAIHAPTVIPIFATNTIAAALFTAAKIARLFHDDPVYLELVTFALFAIAAYATISMLIVAKNNARRRLRRDVHRESLQT